MVGANETSPGRALCAPYQGCGKLETIRSAQRIFIQSLHRQIAQRITWKDFSPRAA
jgi:hypothetical protein